MGLGQVWVWPTWRTLSYNRIRVEITHRIQKDMKKERKGLKFPKFKKIIIFGPVMSLHVFR